WIIGGVLNTPIETANKRDYRTDKAMLLAKAADLRVADSIWLIRSRLKAALLEAYSAQESVKLLEQHITIQTKINQLLEQQATVGEIALVEVTRARITLNQLKIGLDTAHKRIADSRVMLATIIGIPVEGLPANVLQAEEWSSVPDLMQVPVQQMKRVALHSRPDIVAALTDYDAAQSALQLEIANQYPNLSLAPGYTWDLGANYWVLGASLLQLPIFNQNQGPIAEAEAKRKEMAQRFLALQLKVISDVDRANAGLQSIADKWTEVERQQQMQKKHQEEVQANYDGGEADQITLLLAKIEDIATQRSALDVLIESHQAENGLEDTLRQPMHSVLSANLQARADH
ncbi:MAG TPA: TolC family protein, partial [Methylophilus sp.]|nr:TolC family protein [Methylophilus sp.]